MSVSTVVGWPLLWTDIDSLPEPVVLVSKTPRPPPSTPLPEMPKSTLTLPERVVSAAAWAIGFP